MRSLRRISLDIGRRGNELKDMSLSTEMIFKALELSADDRAELARQLILSLDGSEADNGAEEAWNAEIQRRLSAMDRQAPTLIDWRETVARARAALPKVTPR
jgi:putative addiction module component (TIGR02574 family)